MMMMKRQQGTHTQLEKVRLGAIKGKKSVATISVVEESSLYYQVFVFIPDSFVLAGMLLYGS